MSLTARLHIEGHSNEDTGSPVLSCDFGFSQDIDETGMVQSRVRGGIISLSIRGVDDSDILQWMMDQGSTKNGRIQLSGYSTTGVSGPRRRIEFEDGYLINYRESFANQTDVVVHLTISARKITVSGVDHENIWTGPDEAAD